jgi:hypothetical protein
LPEIAAYVAALSSSGPVLYGQEKVQPTNPRLRELSCHLTVPRCAAWR